MRCGKRFSGGPRRTLWYYRTLSEFFSRALPGPLATTLAETVGKFPS